MDSGFHIYHRHTEDDDEEADKGGRALSERT